MEAHNYYGNYASVEEAMREVQRLEDLGYTRDEISILSKDKREAEEIRRGADLDEPTIAEADAAAGAATGAALGGLGGLLAAAGALVIPGIGPILAAGPIAAALTGAATGGLVGGALGGIVGILTESGIDETEARRLNERFDSGDIIVYAKRRNDLGKDGKVTYTEGETIYNENPERDL